jgi:DNA-binding NarL/FixJ family response regulator
VELGHAAGSQPRPRVIVADDHRMVAQSLAATLAGDYEVVGTAFSGEELQAIASRQPADCFLLDLMMPGGGLELIPALRSLQPAAKIVIVTVLEDRVMAAAAMEAGADGFVPKVAGIAELKAAIGEVLVGRRYVSSRVPKATRRIGAAAAHPALANLTPREHEVLLLLGRAKTETEIASQFGVGVSTVARHTQNLMRKLGVGTHAALIKFAILLVTSLSASM